MSHRPGTWIQLEGHVVHFDEAGEGPAVIVAPGLGLSTRFYEPLLSAFARAGLRLIVPDLPGFGRTGGPVTGSSVGELAGWLVRFADRLGLEQPAWLGHSVGCQVALQLAARHPDRAAALVLAAPTGAPVRLRLTRQLLALPRAALREPGELLLAVARDYVRVLPTAYMGTWLRAGRDDPMRWLDRISCPTLLCMGDRDPICSPGFLQLLAAGIDGARSEIIPSAGHGLPRDAVEPFTRSVAAFLRRPLPGPGRAPDHKAAESAGRDA